MKIKLFSGKAEPACKYCVYGRISSGVVFCKKKGITDENFSCRKYEYDALKRIPQKVKLNSELTENDFKI